MFLTLTDLNGNDQFVNVGAITSVTLPFDFLVEFSTGEFAPNVEVSLAGGHRLYAVEEPEQILAALAA